MNKIQDNSKVEFD